MTTDQKPSKPKPNGKPKLSKTDDVTATPHSNGTSCSKSKTDDVITDNNSVTVNGSSNGILYNIPMHRVNRIIKSEDSNIRITQEALFVVNKASLGDFPYPWSAATRVIELANFANADEPVIEIANFVNCSALLS
nr:DNA polymerase epsilon subunit C [Tanacetum cinerariifolium]